MLIDWDKAARASSMRPLTERRVVTGQQVSVVRVDTEASAKFNSKPHRHHNEQWVVVTAGQLRMTCDDQEFELSTGDVVFIPSHSWHAAVGVGSQGARYLEFSAPPRLDLLPDSLVPSALEFDETEHKDY
jgi:quercetin dioxygenase-like cupin family protein